MSLQEHQDSNFIEKKRSDFKKTIEFLYQHLGTNAFKNINNENEYQSRFNPTVFDSIAIATNYVLERRSNIDVSSLEKNHKILLHNETYKKYTTSRTTNIEHINGRISLATQILYNLNYE